MVVLNSLLIPPDSNSDADLPAAPEACPPADSFAALLAASWFTPQAPDLPRAEIAREIAKTAAPAIVAAFEPSAPTPNLLPASFPDLALHDQSLLASPAPAPVSTFDFHSLSRLPLLATPPAPAAENEEAIMPETGQSAALQIEPSENAAIEFEQMDVRSTAFRRVGADVKSPPEGGTTNTSLELPPLDAHDLMEISTPISASATSSQAEATRKLPAGFQNEPGQEAEPERLSAKDQSQSFIRFIENPEEPFTSSSPESLGTARHKYVEDWQVIQYGERERPELPGAVLWPSRRSLTLTVPHRILEERRAATRFGTEPQQMQRSAATELTDEPALRALHDAEITAPVSVTTEADNKPPAFAEGRPTVTAQMLIEADAEPVLSSSRPVADVEVRLQKNPVQLVEVESESPAVRVNKDAPDELLILPLPEDQPLASAEEDVLLEKPVKIAQPQNQEVSSEEPPPIRQDPFMTRKLYQAEDDGAANNQRLTFARLAGIPEQPVSDIAPRLKEEWLTSSMKTPGNDEHPLGAQASLPARSSPVGHPPKLAGKMPALPGFSEQNSDLSAAAPAQPPIQNEEAEAETENRAVTHRQPQAEPRQTRPLGARPTETSNNSPGAGLAENAKPSHSQTPRSPAAFEAPGKAISRHQQNDQDATPADPPSSDAPPAPLSFETAQAQNAPGAAPFAARAPEIIRQTIEPVVVAASRLERRETRALSLHLHPAELGEVEVTLTRHGDGRLSAHLTAQQETARDALADGLGQLRESLERAGLAINQLDVNLSSHSGPNTSAHAGDGHARSPLPHFGPATPAPEPADASLDVEQDRLLSLRA